LACKFNNGTAFDTPPGQTTVPGNPSYSGGSTGTSSSLESKPETYAQNVANDFLKIRCLTISDWLEGMGWANPAVSLYLSLQYVVMYHSDCSNRERLETRLGIQKVNAIDDGGVSMYFQYPPSSSKESRRVVLSVEAKRKKTAKENNEDTANRDAAQIFAEMLGQVCRPELYQL
jgi:hypothetical protein